MVEWKEYKLGDICTKIGSGATPKGGKEAYLGGNTSLIRSQNVLDFSFSWDGLAYIDDEQAAKLNGVEIAKGDVLLNITGDSVARACVVPESALPARVNQHVSIIRGDTSLVLNDYILYFLQYKKTYLLSLSQGGATRNALTKGMIEDLIIPLPPLSKQTEIVRVLKSLDDKIENNRRINENMEQQAQALFKSWFVDFEPFRDGEFVESELGMIPKGWKAGKLGELCKCVLGGTPSRNNEEFWNGDIPWINSGEVNEFRITKPSEYITEEGLAHSATKLLPKKTTVLAITGATLGQVSLLEIDSCTNQSVIGVLENENTPYEFIYPLINDKIKELISHMTGGAQQHINKNNVEQLEIIVPSDNVMNDYKTISSPIYAQIGINCFESRRLAELRDALLPKLMSGELKVGDKV